MNGVKEKEAMCMRVYKWEKYWPRGKSIISLCYSNCDAKTQLNVTAFSIQRIEGLCCSFPLV